MKIWINADDYGWDKSCSEAILEAINLGWLTTTTACANGNYFREAANMIKQAGYADKVGIHFNITEGKPLTKEISHIKRIVCGEEFYGFPSRQWPLSKKQQDIVYQEFLNQLSIYRLSGLPVNHIDSHHFIHNAISTFPIITQIATETGINRIRKFRNVGNISLPKKIIKKYYNAILQKKRFLYSDYFGDAADYLGFTGGNEEDVFEIMVHPDYTLDGFLIDRTNDDYNNPTGESLELLIAQIYKRGDIIIH